MYIVACYKRNMREIEEKKSVEFWKDNHFYYKNI